MAKYRKIASYSIEAIQWFKEGDHPDDCSCLVEDPDQPEEKTEGSVVGRVSSANLDEMGNICTLCGKRFYEHGRLRASGVLVFPGDWIITTLSGRYYPLKPDIFEQIYERVDDD